LTEASGSPGLMKRLVSTLTETSALGHTPFATRYEEN
jgi:hypothetical protein